mgnify:CR=1 FL=1
MEQFLGGLQILLNWQNFLIIPIGLKAAKVMQSEHPMKNVVRSRQNCARRISQNRLTKKAARPESSRAARIANSCGF